MRKILVLIAAITISIGPALAQTSPARNTPVVVELFTSQGCSSCPPADRLLHKLAGRDDVIALALHVDYWDYIGWKDVFGRAENTSRQRAYARAGGRKMIFTPQMIIGGRDQVVGNRTRDVLELIDMHRAAASHVRMTATRQGDRLRIAARAEKGMRGTALVQVVRYTPKAAVDITRGENAGHRLTYSNIVTGMRIVREWDMRKPLDVSTQIRGDQPVVVLIQQKGPGPVVAAARVK